MNNYKYLPYSFSKISTYKQCAKKFEFQYILKPATDVEVNKFHLEKGDLVHLLIENVLKGTISTFKPPKYDFLTSENIKEIYSLVIKFCKSEFFLRYKKSKLTKFTEQ